MKPTTLVYCGEDGDAGKAIAASLRDGNSQIVLCSAGAFTGRAERVCERVLFTDDVNDRLRAAICAAHGLPVAEKAAAVIPAKRRGRKPKAA